MLGAFPCFDYRMDYIYLAQAVEDTAQQAASTPDLFWTIIASAFGGAIITSGVTIWSKFAETKAEHKRWLREEKLKVYSEFSELGYRITGLVTDQKLDEAHDKMNDLIFAIAQIRLLAPSQIALGALSYERSARSMFRAALDSPDKLDDLRQEVIVSLDALMQKMKIDLSIALHKRALGQNDVIKQP